MNRRARSCPAPQAGKERGNDEMAHMKGVPFTLPNGLNIELYPIGALAAALGRLPDTVRKWEVSGILPPTPFKHDQRRVRLYSQEMIDIIVSCAEKAHISQGRSISHTPFQKMVHEELDVLYKRYRRKKLPGRKKKDAED